VKLRIRRSQINEIIGMPKDRRQLPPLDVIKKSADFVSRQRSGKPLHVVLHEHLHGAAVDRTRALNRHAYTAVDGHVRAEKKP
jgi:hypothetical protein